MRISTSLNILRQVSPSYIDVISAGVDAGFKCFDMNVCDYVNDKDSFYMSENWRDELKKIKEFADKNGVDFFQSHAHMITKANIDHDYYIKKSIEAAQIAGVKWTVMHTWDTEDEYEILLNKNIELFRPYIEYAKERNVGIAIENAPERIYWFGEEIHGVFRTADELMPLVDTLNSEFGNVGVCWDTGHANLTMKSQYEDIIKLGKRLKVTHIADNSLQYDDHLPPFYGYTDFRAIMKALKEIGYEGTFNFETHNFTNKLPTELVGDAARFMYKIGEYIVNNY